MNTENTIRMAVFEGKHIRKVFLDGEWWFAVIDIVEVLTESSIPKRYWTDLKRKLASEGYMEVSEKIGQLKMPAPDGKMRLTDCANTETMFRIIQSIPSPKAEPFKIWHAKGYAKRKLHTGNHSVQFDGGRLEDLSFTLPIKFKKSYNSGYLGFI